MLVSSNKIAWQEVVKLELQESNKRKDSELRALLSLKDDQAASCIPLPAINSSVVEEALSEQEYSQGGITPDLPRQHSVPLPIVQMDSFNCHPSTHDSTQLPSIQVRAAQRSCLPPLLVGIPEIPEALPKGEDQKRSTLEMDRERTVQIAKMSLKVEPSCWSGFVKLKHSFFNSVLGTASSLSAAQIQPVSSRCRHSVSAPGGITMSRRHIALGVGEATTSLPGGTFPTTLSRHTEVRVGEGTRSLPGCAFTTTTSPHTSVGVGEVRTSLPGLHQAASVTRVKGTAMAGSSPRSSIGADRYCSVADPPKISFREAEWQQAAMQVSTLT
jgi:hypothetical protein